MPDTAIKRKLIFYQNEDPLPSTWEVRRLRLTIRLNVKGQ